VCIVTDNASNCQEAGLLLEPEFPVVTWLGCLPAAAALSQFVAEGSGEVFMG
jgi:hypothetical protein